MYKQIQGGSKSPAYNCNLHSNHANIIQETKLNT